MVIKENWRLLIVYPRGVVYYSTVIDWKEAIY
jgi:hypothetical protein